MSTIHFNTGRPYGDEGQRITATLHQDGVVTFYDHTRMIDGEFPLLGPLTMEAVMLVYDRCAYETTMRSMCDCTGHADTCNRSYKGD